MNRRDQQLLAEAYRKIVEAAPQTLGSRVGQGLKGWALDKLESVPIFRPFIASAKERLESDVNARKEINKNKADFEAAYRQKYGQRYNDKVGSDLKFVEDFIKGLNIDVNSPSIRGVLQTDPVTDKDLNEALRQAYAVKVTNQGSASTRKANFKKIIDEISAGTLTGNHMSKIKSMMGDWTKTAQDVQFTDSHGNRKKLSQIIQLLKSSNPTRKMHGVDFLKQFYSELD